MAFRELTMIEVREVLRRLQKGQPHRRIARETGRNRKTVQRYAEAAQDAGLTAESELTDELVNEVAQCVQRRTPPAPSEQRMVLRRHKEQIKDWLDGDKPLKLTKVHRLLARRGVPVPYPTLRRFVIDELGWRKKPVTVRIDDPAPGYEAQADFGKMGVIFDPTTGRKRTVWALIVTLSFSRHMFVWPTFDQTLASVCEGLDAAWSFFGGVVEYLIVDNLKPVVAKADAEHPQITEAFMEYAQMRDFLVDPARKRKPKDKPRVENQVSYVREDWFEGEDFADLEDTRRHAVEWSLTVAGVRTHGTTRRLPLRVFETEEQPHLKPAPTEPFDVPRYAEPKVHPDHHIQFQKALYSVPTRYIGERVRVRGDRKLVRIYLGTELIKVHPTQPPGGRSTDPNDYPKDKAAYAFRNVDALVDRAYDKGEQVGAFMHRLLEGPLPWTRMRQGYKVIRLCDKYGKDRVNEACRRALAFEVMDTQRIERMLKAALVHETDAREKGKLVQLPLPDARFARPSASFETLRRRDRGDGGEEGTR